MSVADTIQELATDIGNAYDEVQTKGGTLPQNKNTNNLATAIGSIPSGSTPTGQIEITQNGTYDVTDYASASVAVQDMGGFLPPMRQSYPEWDAGYSTLQFYSSLNINAMFFKIPTGATKLKVTSNALFGTARNIILCENFSTTLSGLGNYTYTTISGEKINVSDTYNYVCISYYIARSAETDTYLFE